MKSTFAARLSEALIEENYTRWQHDPASVGPDWAAFFDGFELGCARPEPGTNGSTPADGDPNLQTRVDGLV